MFKEVILILGLILGSLLDGGLRRDAAQHLAASNGEAYPGTNFTDQT